MGSARSAVLERDGGPAVGDHRGPPHDCRRAGGRRSRRRRARRKIRDYLLAHLDEPIDVETLAGLTGRSQFHFSRTSRREVGVSPHRYVVHLRLGRAIDLVRDGRLPLAEIAAATGFADQSHLSRWVKRAAHGGSLTQLTRRRATERGDLQDHASQGS